MSAFLKERRPLSPHLQIYKIQITSLLSIFHRGTGIVLYGGAILWSLWFAALALGPKSYTMIQSFFFHPLGVVVLTGWYFSFFYHFCNGIRHLAWDLGYGYEMTTVRRTGWIVVGSSIFLALLALGLQLLSMRIWL